MQLIHHAAHISVEKATKKRARSPYSLQTYYEYLGIIAKAVVLDDCYDLGCVSLLHIPAMTYIVNGAS